MGATLSVEDQFEGDERALLKRIQELLDIRWVLPRPHFIWPRSTALIALMPLPPA